MDKLPALEDIRVFVTAARLMSFARAAEQLMVSPAYVSKRIKLLEENLGLVLFFRSARAISLTPEGEIVLGTGEQLLQQLAHMKAALGACREEISGVLRISCSTGFGAAYLNPFILSLRARYPQLGIDLTLVDRPVDLIGERMDLDLCIGGTLPEQHIARRLANNIRILCASPDYLARHGRPEHPKELERQHTCICIRERNQAPAAWKIESGEERMTVSPNSSLSVNNGDVAKQWCLNGEGILLRSIWSVAKELEQGLLVRVLPAWYQTADVYAVYTRSVRTSANLRVFIESLETYLADNMQWKGQDEQTQGKQR
ncbi:LysR substrate-binding domain-containing protein [Oceanimonas sp. MB9]|uniref:LysR substrate-binding domain-containing protein n=1 Tax=Oceanimonas sp. MB9 TaxID=2588453 RepID=UPI0013F606AD|nr:LysR substrate-binding domain-containing protein [Oceanimonas sp. MB9]NHH99324.1 HTH-type transcriptional regulator DmlR [Oceanimonas sp. MB9]